METLAKWLAIPLVRRAGQSAVALLLGAVIAVPLVADVLPPGVARCLAEPGVLSALRLSPPLPTPSLVQTSPVLD